MTVHHPLEDRIGEVLLTSDQIQGRIAGLAEEISRDYEGRELVLLCILKGSMMFSSDLMRRLTLPVVVDFMAVSSYGSSTSSSGVVRIQKDVEENLAGRHVLVVEDIVDTGLTLSYLLATLRLRQPASLKVCCLLDKPSRRKVEVQVDYLGFSVEDRFVIGYGLDYAEHYRNLGYIGVMKDGAA